MKRPSLHQELHNLSIFKVHPVVIGYGRISVPIKSWLQSQCIEHHEKFAAVNLAHSFVAYCFH